VSAGQWMALVAAAVAVLARVAPLVAVSPFGALVRLPSLAQAALAAAVTAWVLFVTPGVAFAHSGPLTWGDVLAAALGNALVGFAFALAARFLYAAFEVAGGYLDLVFGFSISATLAPAGADTTLVQEFIMLLGTFVFLSLGGLTDMVGAVAASFRPLPAFAPLAPGPGALSLLLRAFTTAVDVGTAVAAPLMLAMLLVNLLVGALSRLIPQINLLAFDFPLLMILGLVLFALSLPVWLGVADNLLSDLGSAVSALAGAA
jgi:flagellar biosynthetic protein FliR